MMKKMRKICSCKGFRYAEAPSSIYAIYYRRNLELFAKTEVETGIWKDLIKESWPVEENMI